MQYSRGAKHVGVNICAKSLGDVCLPPRWQSQRTRAAPLNSNIVDRAFHPVCHLLEQAVPHPSLGHGRVKSKTEPTFLQVNSKGRKASHVDP
mmetsp:Transcript_1316/g.3382  ORF Transcript_1316/g.3382 Transcript_1316/m.3382 type:complete len:92 (-) Transcript_1316:85-360(-)